MKIDRWEIWLAGLDPVVGSEQGKTRPVLVISRSELNSILPVVTVLPLTSRKPGRRIYPNEALLPASESGRESIVLAYQIRTLDKRRLIKLLGQVTDEKLRESILTALRFHLDISDR